MSTSRGGDTLLITASSTLLLGLILWGAGAPAWSWVTILVLAGITSLGAVVTRNSHR